MLQDQRSTIAPENLQALIDATVSSKSATLTGQQQYSTPPEWAELFASQLPSRNPLSRLDPQCAAGNLLTCGFPSWNRGFVAGIEIDRRIQAKDHPAQLATGNCVTAWDLLEQHFPDINFVCQVANPPFGIRWKLPDGSTMDSTEYTWKMIERFAAPDGYGYFVANHKTIERLGLHTHPWTYLYQKLPIGLWKHCEVEVGVIHWHRTDQTRPPAPVISFNELNPALYREATKGLAPEVSYYNPDATTELDLEKAWKTVTQVLKEESRPKPYNVYLESGKIRIYLSTRFKLDRKIKRSEVEQLARMDNCHPLTLTTEVKTRRVLQAFLAQDIYTIEPAAAHAIEQALEQAVGAITPIMPPTDFELVGYADECESLRCINSEAFPAGPLTQGRRYPIRTGTYTFTQSFSRKKQHWIKGENVTLDHSCELSGQDRFIEITDDDGNVHRFMDRPDPKAAARWKEHEDHLLWTVFQAPNTETVKEVFPDRYAKLRWQLDELTELIRQGEGMEDFAFYPGQIEYLARVGTNDRALVAADVGCGKTLMALTLLQLQLGLGPAFNGRALIVAPQGTIKDQKRRGQDDIASQWKQEIQGFAPGVAVFTITNRADVGRIIAQHGHLPKGIYISYYESLFKNGAIENITASQDHFRICQRMGIDPGPTEPCYHIRNIETGKIHRYAIDELADDGYDPGYIRTASAGARAKRGFTLDKTTDEPVTDITKGVGRERNGVTCVVQSCLAAEIFAYDPNAFDATVLDEAQVMTNLNAQVTQRICKIQTPIRYALSATPIPNIVSNLFSIMGWLCVDDWFRGEKRSARWPYAVNEIERFNETFLSTERDYTSEELRKDANQGSSGKCLKPSPVISAPARLLKLIKPTLAFISKKMCNPAYQDANITDIRVPMGTDQSLLYAHYLDPNNTPVSNAWQRNGIIIGRLREIAASPQGSLLPGPQVTSDFNPKLVACLELVASILERGEQVVIISSRIEQSNIVHNLLAEGIGRENISRIDSTVGAKNAAGESAKFKSGDTRVMIMGIKCAAGHSFSHCPHEIILSIEYSYGPFHQAKGRIDRVNSAQQANIYVMLHKDSIEESMFDNCALKQDAATICLHGQRIPRDYIPVDMADVLADHMEAQEGRSLTDTTTDESELELGWPALLERIQSAHQTAAPNPDSLPAWLVDDTLPNWLFDTHEIAA